MNGGDANDQFVNLPTVQPTPDSIEEFRVLTNTFDAEYGRNSGSVVNVVTKSGTNQFHGNVYEFFRNKVLNAKGYFESGEADSSIRTSSAEHSAARSRRTGHSSSRPMKAARSRQGIPSTDGDCAHRGGAAQRHPAFRRFPDAGGFSRRRSTNSSILNSRPGCQAAITSQWRRRADRRRAL